MLEGPAIAGPLYVPQPAIEFPDTRYYVDEIEKQAAIYREFYPDAFVASTE